MTVKQVKRQVYLIPGQSAFLAATSLALGHKLLYKTGIEGIGTACLLAQSAVIVFRPLWRKLVHNKKAG
ncbi:MAG TPA: hypothetical protein GXX19_10755 [Syntrophomonadaceae bacterium]|nr:hypothetical protein [Syntrophomonadaceae bacterium]